MLVLEREDRALARGATRLRAHRRLRVDLRRLSPRADGSRRRRDRPLHRDRAVPARDRRPEEIGYINYHGTSTQLNDAIESRCVRRVFGRHADAVPGSSTKSMIGHPQGASGAAGVATTALAMTRGVLPPTINLDDPDPACDMDFIPNTARAGRHRRRALQLPGLRIEEQRARAGTRREPRPHDSAGMRRRRPRRRRRAGGQRRRTDARARRRARAPDRSRAFPRDKLCGDTLNPGALRFSTGWASASRRARLRAADHRHDRDRTGAQVAADYPDGLRGDVAHAAVSRSAAARCRCRRGRVRGHGRRRQRSRASTATASWACAWREASRTVSCARAVVIAADGRGSQTGRAREAGGVSRARRGAGHSARTSRSVARMSAARRDAHPARRLHRRRAAAWRPHECIRGARWATVALPDAASRAAGDRAPRARGRRGAARSLRAAPRRCRR